MGTTEFTSAEAKDLKGIKELHGGQFTGFLRGKGDAKIPIQFIPEGARHLFPGFSGKGAMPAFINTEMIKDPEAREELRRVVTDQVLLLDQGRIDAEAAGDEMVRRQQEALKSIRK